MSRLHSLPRYLVYLAAITVFVAPTLLACRPPSTANNQPPQTASVATPLPDAAAIQAPTTEPALPATPLATVVAGATAEVATPTAAATNSSYAELGKSIEAQLRGLNGEWGIGVQDLDAEDALLIGAGRPYPAASLYKLLLLYEAYRQIEDGNLELERMTRMLESDYVESVMWDEELKIGDRVSVKGLLRVMIIQSSNAAAHALNRVMALSSIPEVVNAAANALGLSQTHMPVPGDRARFGDWRAEQTSTSVNALRRYFTLLYRGQLVSKQASQEMVTLLQQQQINDRIPARLPAGVKVAHKTGNLTGVVADAGIMFGPRADVLLIVLNDGADYEPGTAAIGKIAEVVYAWHNR